MATTVNYERSVYDAGARENYRAFAEGKFLMGVSETAGLMDREMGLCQRLYSYDHKVPGQASQNIINASASLRKMYDAYCAAVYQPDAEEKAEIISHGKDALIEVRRASVKLSQIDEKEYSEPESVKALLESCERVNERIHASMDVMRSSLNEGVSPRCLVNHAWEVTRTSEEACILSRMSGILGEMKAQVSGELKEFLECAEYAVRRGIRSIDADAKGPRARADQISRVAEETSKQVLDFLAEASKGKTTHTLRVSLHELLDAVCELRAYAKTMKESDMADWGVLE